jgi:hypothetical protein
VRPRTFSRAALTAWRQRTYSELVAAVGQTIHIDAEAPSGVKYQIDIQPIWDDKSKGHIRVLGLVDDGGIRAFVPLSDDFIVAPDGTFVDE